VISVLRGARKQPMPAGSFLYAPGRRGTALKVSCILGRGKGGPAPLEGGIPSTALVERVTSRRGKVGRGILEISLSAPERGPKEKLYEHEEADRRERLKISSN